MSTGHPQARASQAYCRNDARILKQILKLMHAERQRSVSRMIGTVTLGLHISLLSVFVPVVRVLARNAIKLLYLGSCEQCTTDWSARKCHTDL